MVDRGLLEQLTHAAIARLEPGGAEIELPAGVRVLDNWRSAEYAAVLFWADRELDVWGSGEAVLHHVDLKLVDGIWHGCGRGGAGTFSAAEILGDLGCGLHRVGGSSADPVRLTRAIASTEVAMIELRSDHGVLSRPPGVDGFCLLGITHSDPITYASALDTDGRPLPGAPLLL
jgi:hypothetical protein